MVTTDAFTEKVTNDLEAGKAEMATEYSCMRQLIDDYNLRLTSTMARHEEHKDHFNRIEGQLVDYTRAVEQAKDELDDKVGKMLKTWKLGSEKKLWKFTEGIMSEFKYMSKRCEDKVLFEVGYHDKLWQD